MAISDPVTLTVYIDPVPASRPRVTRRGFSYYAKPYATFKRQFEDEVAKVYQGKPISEDVVVEIRVFVQRPKSTKLAMPRPDVDNYAKAVLDGMNSVVLVDDRQVHRLTVSKFWTSDSPRVEIRVDPV